MNVKAIVNTLIFVIILKGLNAQEIPSGGSPPSPSLELNRISIASPNAASLGKYIDFPINYHTGVPEISIPIYTIVEGDITIPISLSYNASGIRVSEVSSWVGLGWALNAGGVISRTVKGKPDEVLTTDASVSAISYYKNHGFMDYLTNSWGDLDWHNFAMGYKDGEPDLFFFNFNGYSGKFFFREDNTPVAIPHQNIRIEPIFCQAGENCNSAFEKLRSWKITTPDGVKYYFGISLDPATHGSPAIEKTHPHTQKNGNNISKTVSSWYLYKIQSPDDRFTVNFKYQSESYAYYTIVTGEHLQNNYQFEGYSVLAKNNVEGVRLTEINFSNGSVKFIPDNVARLDLSGLWSSLMQTQNTEGKALKSIEITGSNFCKKYQFTYDYFNADSNPLKGELASIQVSNNITCDRKRLKLISLQESSCDSSLTTPGYNFEYFDETLPSTLSYAIDHWGYYNGKATNNWLMPNISLDGGTTYTTQGADRESSWPEMRAGSLKSIQYPTSGKTSFTFDCDEVTIYPQQQGQQTLYYKIGGLKIKEILQQDQEGVILDRTQFEYPSGVVLFSVPSYIYKVRNSSSYYAGGLSGNGTLEGCYKMSPSPLWYMYMTSTGSIRPMTTTNGYHKGYEDVKVIKPGLGYSLYTYNVEGAPYVGRGVSVREIKSSECTGFEPVYPPIPDDHSFLRGTLVFERHYKEGVSNPLSEKKYIHEFQKDLVGAHGLIMERGMTYYLPGEYQLKSGRKIKEKIIEKTLDLSTGNYLETLTERKFESLFHNYVTSESSFTISTDPDSKIKENKYKYVKDFSPCNLSNAVYENLYLQNISLASQVFSQNSANCSNSSARATFCNSLRGCNAYPLSPCSGSDVVFSCRRCSYSEFLIAVNDVRKNYVNSLLNNNESVCLNNINSVQNASYEALLQLNKKNQVNLKVEQSTFNKEQLLSSSLMQFDKTQNGIYPVGSRRVELQQPISKDQFQQAAVSNQIFQFDEHYNIDVEANYKFNNGRLVEIRDKAGNTSSYIWDGTNNFVLVKGENVSFENLLSAHQNALLQGNYGSEAYNTWLRSILNTAIITTYTYKALVGIESITDYNNITSYYFYDSLGRLTELRDHNNNIVKTIDYTYKGQ